MALTNAQQALASRLASRHSLFQRFEALQDALGLDALPERLECFDVSHSMGEAPVAACVVFDPGGAVKSDYRRFNITGVAPGDDYAAMRAALTRRYTRLKAGEGKLPDVLFIDGGKGQVAAAQKVLEELQISALCVVGVAKGVSRRPGHEVLIINGVEALLEPDSSALHLIQQVRDEAHRFAITGHRTRRSRRRNTSTLELVAGVGPKRRRELLRQLGGLQEVARAGVEDLARVPGINRELAQRIYDALHPES
jgi:excinuclease ABC subunit C